MKILPFTLCFIGFLLVHHSVEGTFVEIVERMTLKYSCPNNQFAVAMPQDSDCHPRIQVKCSPNANIKFGHHVDIFFPRPLKTGDRISLIGTPTADVVWELALKNGDTMVLYMVVRFTFQGYRQVVFDCYTPQLGWSTCQGSAGSFPFDVNRQFKTTILVRDVDFKIYVDGVEIYTFANSFPATALNKLYVAHDVTIKAVLLI